MKVLWLLFILTFFSFQSSEKTKTIRLENLKLNQNVRIEWQLPGEYALVQHYELNFHVATDIQIEAKNLLKSETAENRPVTIYLSREELKDWDKTLDLYREQKVLLCADLPVHNVTVSLFEDGQVKLKESFNNRCLHSKLSEFINSLEQQSACNNTER